MLPTGLFTKQVAKFNATRLSALSRWPIVTYGRPSILEIDPVVLLDIDYVLVEYYLDRGFNFLISSRIDWTHDRTVPSGLLDVYTDGSKLDCGVDNGVYSTSFSMAWSNTAAFSCGVTTGRYACSSIF